MSPKGGDARADGGETAKPTGPPPTHAQPAPERYANNVRSVLLRTPIRSSLAGEELAAEVARIRGPLPVRTVKLASAGAKVCRAERVRADQTSWV